jgi:sialate O-acetylesterase
MWFTAWLCAALVPALGGEEGLRLPAFVSDGMVLQRESSVPITGWARPGAEVRVRPEWADEQRVTARADGTWTATLNTPAAGGPFTIRVAAEREITLSDVLVGEVWLCAGQSNMEWCVAPGDLGGIFDAEKEIAAADHPRIRHFDVANATAFRPQHDVRGQWTACSPGTVGRFSAVAYFFAREIERELDVPVGLINATWSGTRIQAWLPEEVAATMGSLEPQCAAFRAQRELHESAGRSALAQIDPQTISVLYNGMVAPLAPSAVRGFLWYQGESNRTEFTLYGEMLPALIDGWRRTFGGGDKPFYFVQIAPFCYDGDVGEAGALRDVQRRCLAHAGTGMAVTMDVGDPDDIHPRNKAEVGRRLALWALARTYGKRDLVHSGPLFSKAEIEGARMRLHFDHVAGGLVSGGDHLTGFEIAGADRRFVKARAEIEGACVLVSSSEVRAPVAVRYGFAADSQPILFNRSWLPAAAFRTDAWPLR